jgi:hypothetical protein
MGCKPSVPRQLAPPVERIPEPTELTEVFPPVEGFPSLMTSQNTELTSSDKQIRICVKKTNKNKKGDSFRIKEMELNKDGGRDDWLGENGIFVEPVMQTGLIRSGLDDFTGIYQGKDCKPLGYWICDVSRGVNTFKILKEEQNYIGQHFETFTGRDVEKDKQGNLLATPFHGRSSVDLYTYGYVEFDRKTTLVNIRIYGAPKCHQEGATPFRMRQANATTWILYKYDYDKNDDEDVKNKYKECALFVQSKGTMGFPIYETTISPGIDPVFVTLVLTILDNFWENRLKKARVEFY